MSYRESMLASEALALLGRAEFGELLDQPETLEVEFKGESYRLAEDRQKFELAKDVSAMANANGGVIILGFRTTRRDGVPSDIATELRPIPAGQLDFDRYSKVIESLVYPVPTGIAYQTYEVGGSPGQLVGSIYIPLQPPSLGPFVVARAMIDDSSSVSGSLVAVCERRQVGSVGRMSAQELQSLLRDGQLTRRLLDEPSQGMGRSAAEPHTATGGPRGIALGQEEVTARAASLVEATGLSTGPTFVLVAAPNPAVDASRMFASDSDRIVELLAKPPEIRDMGFGLATMQHPEIRNGQSRRIVLPGYKGLELWSDGLLVFVATASEEFLCWENRTPGAPLRVQAVPLIEASFVFCTLAHQLFALPEMVPEEISYSIHLRRMCEGQEPPRLQQGRGHGWSIGGERRAPACEMDGHVSEYASADPGVVALALVKQVYRWFGLTDDLIPYTVDGKIDPAEISRM